MKNFKRLSSLLLAVPLLILVASCDKEDDEPASTTGNFTVQLQHEFGDNVFSLNENYTNSSGESLKFTNVKYYISNIKLEKMDGSEWSDKQSYYLIDASESGSIELQDVPAGEYHKISYMVGVDSTRNVSGAQEGALDPVHNMFWSWYYGYIFIKLEGGSPAASGNFVYHVGGFQGEHNALGENEHALHNPRLKIDPDRSPLMRLKVDLQKVFDGEEQTIRIADFSTNVQSAGPEAQLIAFNFHSAFSLEQVEN